MLTSALTPPRCGAETKSQAAPTFAAQIIATRKIRTPGELKRLFFDPKTSRLLAECIQSQPYCIRLLDVSTASSGCNRPRSPGTISDTPFGTTTVGAINGKDEPAVIVLKDYSANVLACDFKNGLLYWTSGTIWGWGGYLHKTPMTLPGGKIKQDVGSPQSDHLTLLAFGKRAGRTWRAYVRASTSLDDAGIAYVDAYQGDKAMQRVAPERGFAPRQALYVSGTDQLYLVYGWALHSLSGQTVPLPGQTLSAQYNSGEPVNVLDADEKGQFAYYADGGAKAIYKLRLRDGSLQATCRLPFAPTSLVLDGKRKTLYVADGAGKCVCQVRLF